MAFVLPDRLALDPFRSQDAQLPLTVLVFTALPLLAVATRWRGPALVGAVAGLLASFAALVLRAALSGTPFGYGGAQGDAGRITAMATRYTATWASSDGISGEVPSEYPPLFPYLLGKAALLLDTPAWRLLGPAQCLTVSTAVVVAFVLWSRVTAPPTALVISALAPLALGIPSKAHEILALAIFVPLVLLTIAAPPRDRLGWLPAGLLASVMCLSYHAYLVFTAAGLVPLVWWTWRTAPDRRGHLRYLARVTVTLAVLTSWYTIPYLWAMAHGGQQVGDMYDSDRLSQNPFPFLEPGLDGALQAGGLLGLLWYSRSAWWARPLLALVAGAYAYQAVGMLRWTLTGHSGLYYYTLPLIKAVLTAGLVLSAATVLPRSRPRIRPVLGVTAATVAVLFAGFTFWLYWMPAGPWSRAANGTETWAARNELAVQAHVQPLPDGRLPRYGVGVPVPQGVTVPVGEWRYLPVADIERAVRRTRPDDALPRTVSFDEQVFAFLPWRGYLGVDRIGANGPLRWDDRHRTLRTLAGTTDPAAFARTSARTAFGSIDVFVLRREGSDLVWKGLMVPDTLRFRKEQFASGSFVVTELAADTTVAVRRP
ncbi:hypothetical protein GCM10009678_50740 [Actinomadura kijaniata]|uniref:Arabinofuranosyltransferase AftA N-terminal domain-containing protein n=1 Tax=Actinomadura namibiensis TaxID=182080 RepID=A0A7W3LI21_ACTNM|nr:arabinofuranosyltransferase [Actinomadura namibiensis]MBA8948556.1 hypothetical protein [Actinomadura namibiensis]